MFLPCFSLIILLYLSQRMFLKYFVQCKNTTKILFTLVYILITLRYAACLLYLYFVNLSPSLTLLNASFIKL